MVGLPFVIERYGMRFDQEIRTWRETHNTEQRSLCTLGWVCKLIKPAPARWRAVNGPNLVALVRAGATVINGKLAERLTGSGTRFCAAPSCCHHAAMKIKKA